MSEGRTLVERVCRGERGERVPVWIMRQAGRYLPEYRKLRASVDFKTATQTPELAAPSGPQERRREGSRGCHREERHQRKVDCRQERDREREQDGVAPAPARAAPAGATPDPEGRIPIDMVYTINRAVLFALDEL